MDALRRSDMLMTEMLRAREAKGDYDTKKHEDLQKAQQLLAERIGPVLNAAALAVTLDEEAHVEESDFVQAVINAIREGFVRIRLPIHIGHVWCRLSTV